MRTGAWTRKCHLGVDFAISRREAAWFWFLVNPFSKSGMIGAARDEAQAIHEACLSIETILGVS
jgi:hypothetical protein